MVKNRTMIQGSALGMAALIGLDEAASFLDERQQVINLVPIHPKPGSGYVWKRVFLRGKGHRA